MRPSRPVSASPRTARWSASTTSSSSPPGSYPGSPRWPCRTTRWARGASATPRADGVAEGKDGAGEAVRAADSAKFGRPATRVTGRRADPHNTSDRCAIPVLVRFLALQRQLIRGIASAGVKGGSMLRLTDSWGWDFWLAEYGDRYPLFFLFPARSLEDERRRHGRAAIGHATSDDLRNWVHVGDVVAASEAPAFDDRATWTGSVARGGDGRWWLFYTGVTMVDGKFVQTIGAATSSDLDVWEKQPASPLVTADGRWSERVSGGLWHEEAWRDPWVLADPEGDGWHMLITARANQGPHDDRGVVGHAHSPDLRRWEVGPPLSKPGSGFGHIECPQLASVDRPPA